MRRLLTIAAMAAAIVVRGTGQTATPGIARITAPADDTYLMGAVRLTIAFEPSAIVASVRHVRWFADGRQVCTAEVAPFSCEWEAGDTVREHVIRAVAVLKESGQLVATVRTRAVEFAEIVDVDVVQVTAVVTSAEGRFVTGLKASDFKVYEDDKPQALSSVASENIP